MDDFFDFDHDGEVDPAEFALGMEILSGEESESSDDFEDDLDEELESVGLDRFELEMMDEDERRETLEDAGLDPDDYDDFL